MWEQSRAEVSTSSADNFTDGFLCSMCVQTVIYTVITYPMLQLEWTAAKFFWYAFMQVRPILLLELLNADWSTCCRFVRHHHVP